jgi:hypothetical protein
MCIRARPRLSFAIPAWWLARSGDVAAAPESREVRVLSHFSLTKRSDGWLIAVDGADLLVCARRKAALRAIRDAIARELSLDDHPQADRAHEFDNHAPDSPAVDEDARDNCPHEDRGHAARQVAVRSSSSRRG